MLSSAIERGGGRFYTLQTRGETHAPSDSQARLDWGCLFGREWMQSSDGLQNRSESSVRKALS